MNANHGKSAVRNGCVDLILCIASLLFGALLTFAAAGCRSQSTPSSESSRGPATVAVRPPPRDDDYVGSDVCRECHAALSQRYAAHPMARSLTRIALDKAPDGTDAERAADEAATFQRGDGRTYRVERREGRLVHIESHGGGGGVQAYEQIEPVEWAIGSGRRGKSYCLDRDGWLFMSPLSWYSVERKWDLSPEYDPLHHPRFERPANDRCLQCHAGRLNYADQPTNELHQRYGRPPIAEAMIGCERCHGPGGRHVAQRRATNGAAAAKESASTIGDDPIVQPSRLDARRADDVCNQCHLTGAAQVLRYGRRHADFRPGDLVGDVWVTFLSGEGLGRDGRTKAVSHVEQMHASRCFQGSNGRLGCTSCHDPHEAPEPASAATYFNDRCRQCHADERDCSVGAAVRRQPPAHGSCIACHMPRLQAHDVPHTTQTDHRVPRGMTKPTASEITGRESGNAVDDSGVAGESRDMASWPIFEQVEARLPEWEERRARGLVEGQAAEQQRDRTLAERAAERLRDVVRRAPDDVESLDVLAVCELLLDRPDEAVRRWNEVLRYEPRRQSALQSLMLYWQNRGETTRAAGYAERLVAANPWVADAQGRYSLLLARLGKMDDAVAAAERARRLNPSAPPATKWLAELYRRTGRSAEAIQLERGADGRAP